MFPCGRIAIAMKEEQHVQRSTISAPASASALSSQTSTSSRSVPALPASFTQQRPAASSLRSLLVGRATSLDSLSRAVQRLVSPHKIAPSLKHAQTHQRPSPPSTPGDIDDATLMTEAARVEQSLGPERKICLPAGWIPALPEVDQHWISTTLFRWSNHGQPEIDPSKLDRLWYHPPHPPLNSSAIPSLQQFFGHPLLQWMLRRFWHVHLKY